MFGEIILVTYSNIEYIKYNFDYVGMTFLFLFPKPEAFVRCAKWACLTRMTHYIFATREREGGSDIRHFIAEVIFSSVVLRSKK